MGKRSGGAVSIRSRDGLLQITFLQFNGHYVYFVYEWRTEHTKLGNHHVIHVTLFQYSLSLSLGDYAFLF